jgi:hypothetical protein
MEPIFPESAALEDELTGCAACEEEATVVEETGAATELELAITGVVTELLETVTGAVTELVGVVAIELLETMTGIVSELLKSGGL